jgi:hypothetical protein
MNLAWENFLGNHPALYARKVLRECGFKAPPICEKAVTAHLGLDLREITKEDFDAYGNSTPASQDVLYYLKTGGAWLQRKSDGNPRIWIYEPLRYEIKRLGIFHECSHAIIPWHAQFDYLCRDMDVDPTVRRLIERQAYRCGSEFLFPREMFVQDSLSLEIGVTAIEQLRHRYGASMEATAIWYAHSYPGLCAVLMVRSVCGLKSQRVATECAGSETVVLPHELRSWSLPYPLRVKYSVKSRRFPKYIFPGTGIAEGTLIYEAWATGKRLRGEIPGSVFGSSAKQVYHAECVPLGNKGWNVLVLLWLRDRQLTLDFHEGVMR